MHNTLSTAVDFPLGVMVSIKPHFTVGDFAELIVDSVNSDDQFTESGSDLILLFDGSSIKTHVEYEGIWYENFGNFDPATSKVLAPGSGFFFVRNPSAGTASDIPITFSGVVRMNNFVQKLVPGYQLVASGYPVDIAPTDLDLETFLEASLNFEASESDLLYTWNNGLKEHLLYDDGAGSKKWYQNFGSFDEVTNADLLTASSAMFVYIKDTGHVVEVVRPF